MYWPGLGAKEVNRAYLKPKVNALKQTQRLAESLYDQVLKTGRKREFQRARQLEPQVTEQEASGACGIAAERKMTSDHPPHCHVLVIQRQERMSH